MKPSETDEVKSSTFGVSLPDGIEKNSECNIKVISYESPSGCETPEVAYEGGDEHEESSVLNRGLSDFDLKARDTSPVEEFPLGNRESSKSFDAGSKHFDETAEKDADMMQSGHVSDPGIKISEFWASPNLKRSCSNLETNVVIRKIADQLPPSKCQSFEKLQELAEKMRDDVIHGSPRSVMSHGSADRVMLKKHSSSQILPSRSRRLWWKLFLWSHRNLHAPQTAKQSTAQIARLLNQQGGYCSDTLEPNRAPEFGESPESFTRESLNKDGPENEKEERSWDKFHTGLSGLWPQNQWLAFPTESSTFARVEEWVRHLEPNPSPQLSGDGENEEEIVFPRSPENSMSQEILPSHMVRRSDRNLAEDMLHANSMIRSLNSSSTVALIAGIGLKAIPSISSFVSLRSVNLSSNLIGIDTLEMN